VSARFAYIYLLAGPAAGVEQKIRDQAAALEELGNTDLELVVINPDEEGSRGSLRLVRFPRDSMTSRVGYGLGRFRVIERAIDCHSYDALLLRYPMADRHALRFAERYRVVSEHHTKEIEERAAQIRTPLPPLERLHKKLSLWQELKYGSAYLEGCRGIVAVSDDIRRYQLARSERTTPSLVVPNGIRVDRVSHTRFQPFDGRTFSLAFLAGRRSPWHGVDRFLRSLSLYKGATEVQVHLIGQIGPPKQTVHLPGNVELTYHGTLLSRDLDALLSRMNLAVSSLGLFEISLQATSTLKTREYTARGIPFVIAHDDPDLKAVPKDAQFFLRVPNDDSAIPFDALIEFAERMSHAEREERVSDRMRSYAREHMEWGPKLEQLVHFLRRVSLP
jgi:hypothetical protein